MWPQNCCYVAQNSQDEENVDSLGLWFIYACLSDNINQQRSLASSKEYKSHISKTEEEAGSS
jgi:hypothetical protein